MTTEAVETTTDPETPVVEETPKVEPVRKLRLLDWKLHIPWIDLRVPYWCIWIAALFLGLLLGWSFSDGWGASQWGPLAAWFGGILTAVAVSVSLWQASTAKQKSIKDEVDAANRLIDERQRQQDETAATEKRHQAELERADNRLIAQLNEQRRVEQIEAIKSLCTSINDIFSDTWAEMARVNALPPSPLSPELADTSRRERQLWIRTINSAAQNALLSFIGIQDQNLIERADVAIQAVEALRQKITGPVDQAIDWDSVTISLQEITSRKKVLISMATMILQPEHRTYIINKSVKKADGNTA